MNFPWDSYSDQPHIIKDKAFKKSIYKKAAKDQILTLATTILLSPFVAISYLLFQTKRDIDTDNFFAMGISLDNDDKNSLKYLNDLDIDTILIRFPLNDMDKLENYKNFIEQFHDKDIVINILQDRRHISNLTLFKNDIEKIFNTFKNVKVYQVGNAINRKKWAFFTVKEYLDFYKVAMDVRDDKYPHLKLIGSSVIDFEYHYTIRSLFNFKNIKYDIFSSLLYVDRRGSPQNSQMGFNLKRKINLLNAIQSISPKTTNKLYITETNWPIKNTSPYAPTSEKECVSLEDYALFMVQYYLIALSTNQVDRVYWHQLIAPGYGLIDNRKKDIKLYPAYYAFKTMVKFLKGSRLKEYNLDTEIKFFKFKKDNQNILVYWSDDKLDFKNGIDLYGKEFKGGNFCYIIDGAPERI